MNSIVAPWEVFFVLIAGIGFIALGAILIGVLMVLWRDAILLQKEEEDDGKEKARDGHVKVEIRYDTCGDENPELWGRELDVN